jgi:FeS assembly SUF system protein
MFHQKKNITPFQSKVIDRLREVYDPEIPVNVYDLGLIYDIEEKENNVVNISMTLTAPNCPLADEVLTAVMMKVKMIPEIKDVNVNLTFDPPWEKEMMTEAAMLELGLL